MDLDSALSRVDTYLTAHSALQVLAHRFDHGRSALLDQGYTQLAEYPFSSELKRMSVIYRRPSSNNECVALMKGAVERVLEACRTEDAMRDQVMKNVDAMAARGLRVLGFAARVWTGDVDGVEREEVERDMVFLGLSGIYDPPRASLSTLSVSVNSWLNALQGQSLVRQWRIAFAQGSRCACLLEIIRAQRSRSRTR